MNALRSRARRSAGMTVLEIVCATTLMSLVAGIAVMVCSSSTLALRDGAMAADLDARAQTALDRIAHELRTAGVGTLGGFPASPLCDSRLDYGRIASVDPADGTPAWMPCRIELVLEEGETDDGTDENGNGLVDERVLVVTASRGQADERSVVLTRFVREALEGETADGSDENGNGLVDEEGLCFELIGRTLVVRLTLERANAQGELVTRTVETAVTLRN